MENGRGPTRTAERPDDESHIGDAKRWTVLYEKKEPGKAPVPPVGIEDVGLGHRVSQIEHRVSGDAWVSALVTKEAPAPDSALEAFRQSARPNPSADRLKKLLDRRRRELQVGDAEAIAKSIENLSTVGYRDMIGDLFRREGYTLAAGDGPDADVIDLEVSRGHKRWLINCQLRGIAMIDVAPLVEMSKVVKHSKAAGAFLIADGEFVPEALIYAQENNIILVDRQLLLGMVVELALEDAKKNTLGLRLARMMHPGQGHELRHDVLMGDHKH